MEVSCTWPDFISGLSMALKELFLSKCFVQHVTEIEIMGTFTLAKISRLSMDSAYTLGHPGKGASHAQPVLVSWLSTACIPLCIT